MAKKKKKFDKNEKALIDPREAKLKECFALGMKPENAAFVAGYSQAEFLELKSRNLITEIWAGFDYKDLAERRGITPDRIIAHLAMRAGFFEREDGAKKVVSVLPKIKMLLHGKITKPLVEGEDNEAQPANEQIWDWVEVPDDKVQQSYMSMLLDFLRYTGQAKEGNTVPVTDGKRVINITFNVLPEQGKEIAAAAIKAGMNGNGTKGNGFHVVDP